MIVLTGGGTGGHLMIVKNLQNELSKNQQKLVYIGSTRGHDKEWFLEDEGFAFKYFLPSRGFSKGIFNKILSIGYLLYAMAKVVFIFKNHKITKVISVGGFSASPSSLMAILFRYDLYIHEQNAVVGRLNKICKPFAKGFFCSFPHTNTTHTSYPLRQDFFTYSRIRKELKTIIFLGGSNGASFINDLAINTASFLQERNIKIIHQTGSKDFARVKQAYADKNIQADVFDFSNTIYTKMQNADFGVSRSGASSLWELVSNQLPTIFIPYPHAVHNHQFYNAKFLVDKKLAFLVNQRDFDEQKFRTLVGEICESILDISNISVKLGLLNSCDGAKNILSHTVDLPTNSQTSSHLESE